MPLFDFKCKSCGHEFEAIQKNDAETILCPSCNTWFCEKLLSKVGTYFIKGDNSASTRPKKGR
jgi:putative FmdB family regulatory protein